METSQVTILEGIDTESLLKHILNNDGAFSTLVVCSSKETFLNQLLSSASKPAEQHQAVDESEADRPPAQDDGPRGSVNAPRNWTTPTLRLLASAQTLKLAFCEDVTHLRAYLSAYPYRRSLAQTDSDPSASSTRSARRLAILNLVQVHRETSNFSAQGLNRTFAIAVEAAHQSGGKLLVAECGEPRQADESGQITRQGGASPDRSVWDEEVSVLNTATKTFGPGERGWVGRTVKLRTIAGRWCVFEAWTAKSP